MSRRRNELETACNIIQRIIRVRKGGLTMYKRKIGSLILCLAFITSSLAPIGFADTKKFKDLKDDYWATEFIKVLVESGTLRVHEWDFCS